MAVMKGIMAIMPNALRQAEGEHSPDSNPT